YAASCATFASPPFRRPACAASTRAASSSMTWSSSSDPVGSVVRTCLARAHSRAKPTFRSAHLRSSVTCQLHDLVNPRGVVGPEQLDAVLAGLLRTVER